MPALGLTGNFGMGKTTVLKLFEKSGAHVFSSDDLVHDILKRPAIIRKLSLILGDKVLVKGARKVIINKKIVADEIFSDAEKRKGVEHVIHPEVRRAINALKHKQFKKAPDSIIVFEVPLLFEAGFASIFDVTITVYCKRKTAIDRLYRKGWARIETLKRIRAQMPITKKKELADYLINNDGDIRLTEERVKRIIKKIKKRS